MYKHLKTICLGLLMTSFINPKAKAFEYFPNPSIDASLVSANNQTVNNPKPQTASPAVIVKKTDNGYVLEVDGKAFFINGMNWGYVPIGTNFNYSLWKQPDDLIKSALDAEMSLLKNMGINTIRQYTGIPPKWIQYIYENYGIYTMLNHSFGRYGLTLKGNWNPNTDYANPLVQEILLKETAEMVKEYQNTPGLLLFLLGNENNYGLFWRGAETEDIGCLIEQRRQ